MSQDPAVYAPDDDSAPPARWEQGMAEIADLLAAELQAAGVSGAHGPLGARLACRLCAYMGGRMYYIPKAANLDRARRDLEIASSHDGTRTGPQGVLALAQRHNLSEIHVYRILDRQRELRRRHVQGELFGQDG